MIPKTISQIFEVTSNLKEKGWTYSLEVSRAGPTVLR